MAELIKLIISDNEGTTTVVPFARDDVSIGRKEGNTIRLTERNVSREHCRIQRQNGSFLVRDLGSYNGVILNGKRVEGESAIVAGDELRVGDYTLQLEAEKPAQVEPAAEPAPAAPPPRLVVLTAPVAGAEFSLPELGELRVGRAPELDVTLDHRSVSREHAKIVCEAGEVRIIDQDSVNGVVVNREKVSEARLAPGDVVELGDVLVRFVGAGEHYVFDPAEARALGAHRRAGVQKPQLIAAGLVGAALILAVLIVRGGHKTQPSVQSSSGARPTTARVGERPSTPGVGAPAAQAPAVEHFAELLGACREAVSGGRFAEAIAHATAALKERPTASDALECQQTARADHEQEQIYVRGKAAEQGGDIEGAWKELSTLKANSSVSLRPEISQEVAKVARARLQEGERVLRKEPEQAGAIAAAVLAAAGLPEPIVAQAQALSQHAGKALAAKPARAEAPQRRATVEARPRATAAPVLRPAEKIDRTSPMEAASACLARGDNQCVIRVLNGRAQTAQELGLLIETYRALGDSAQASRSMAAYVQRFPAGRRAEAYRQMLDRQGN